MSRENWSHYGDALAIPFFALLVHYFYQKEHKTVLEYVFLVFSVGGLVLDTLFTVVFVKRGTAGK